MAGGQQTLAAQASVYGGHVLQPGDNDDRRRWGGRQHGSLGREAFVRALQRDLAQVGCYDGLVDGDFGQGTATAVKRFQWVLRNGRHCTSTRMSLLRAIVADLRIMVTGRLDHGTAGHLRSWAGDGLAATGSLRVVPIARFPTFRQGGLARIEHASVAEGDLVVHDGFVEALTSIDRAAGNAGLLFYVNQTMRLAGQPVRGAVVRPASKSQHLIGNAVDFNVEHEQRRILARDMIWAQLPTPVQNFIAEVRAAGLRWGGDWATRDPIHFDAFLDPDKEDFANLYFFNQRTIANAQPIARPA